ncbi:hypothetical protein Sjap_003433 [Stephania japonica]|uniref:Uncharacterized protein n=1 Tax=Stephania japonica TaxID=461633 RepID=A0AAP0KNS4_9MAGN
MERWVVDDGGHSGVDVESEIWFRRFKRRPRRVPLGGPPPSQSRPRRGGEEGWFPLPLRSHSFLQDDQPERQRPSGQPPEVPSGTWKRWRVVVVGVEEGSTSSPLRLPMGGDELPPTRLNGQGSVDPGPVD